MFYFCDSVLFAPYTIFTFLMLPFPSSFRFLTLSTIWSTKFVFTTSNCLILLSKSYFNTFYPFNLIFENTTVFIQETKKNSDFRITRVLRFSSVVYSLIIVFSYTFCNGFCTSVLFLRYLRSENS